MTRSLQIRSALADDAACLNGLAFRSKAHWGYSSELMKAAMDELSVTTDDIKDCKTHYFVATLGSIIAGFYALGELPGTEIELDAMFVEPDLIGSGVGKAMMHHARKSAALLGAARMIIQSDPNAEGFYRAAGGRLTGERESESIPGRFLPTLEIFLE